MIIDILKHICLCKDRLIAFTYCYFHCLYCLLTVSSDRHLGCYAIDREGAAEVCMCVYMYARICGHVHFYL